MTCACTRAAHVQQAADSRSLRCRAGRACTGRCVGAPSRCISRQGLAVWGLLRDTRDGTQASLQAHGGEARLFRQWVRRLVWGSKPTRCRPRWECRVGAARLVSKAGAADDKKHRHAGFRPESPPPIHTIHTIAWPNSDHTVRPSTHIPQPQISARQAPPCPYSCNLHGHNTFFFGV